MKYSITKLAGEFVCASQRVLGDCGRAGLAAEPYVRLLGRTPAFGLPLLKCPRVLGRADAGRFTPAVSIDLLAVKCLRILRVARYIASQSVGMPMAAVFYALLRWRSQVCRQSALPAGTERFPCELGLLASILLEMVIKAVFMLVIFGFITKYAAYGMTGLAI